MVLLIGFFSNDKNKEWTSDLKKKITSISIRETGGGKLHVTFKSNGKRVTSKAASLAQISATSLLLIATRPSVKNIVILKTSSIDLNLSPT
jgi:hypothetical protein